jgi:cell division protein FtsZ
MVSMGVVGVEFYVLNTDAQALRISPVHNKIALGARITNGLGAGSDPEIGRQAALEDTDRIIEVLEGADMVFVAAGLGGGTGTGAAPVVAALAKELGALTVAVVTRPFRFEGPRRMQQAQKGLAELAATCDTVISIPNDRLVDLVPPGTSFFEAFRLADDVLRQGVQGISDIITTPGLINRDFADVRAIMTGMGFAIMGTASAQGPNAALEAAKAAIQCPLLEEGGLVGARAILLNITAPGTLTLHEMHDACELIRKATGNEDVQVNFGLVASDQLVDEVKITVIATGFQRDNLPEVERVSVPASASSALHRSGTAPAPAPAIVPRIVEQPAPAPAVAPVAAPEAEPGTESEPAPRAGTIPEAESRFDQEPVPEAAADFVEELEPEPLPFLPPPMPAPRPAPPPPPDEDAFAFDDIETPAFLRRERKLFEE